MSAAVKGAAALGATAVVIGGTGVGAKFLLDAQEPNAITLTNIDANKYATDYKRYFVDDVNTSNNKWWDWVFKNRYEFDKNDSSDKRHTFLDKFKDLTSGSGNAKSLKKVCGAAYKEVTSNVVDKSSATSESNKYSEQDVWRYCSVFGNKPKTIQEANTNNAIAAGKYGKDKETSLIDVDSPENNLFWEKQEKDFFGDSGLGVAAQGSSIFKTLHTKTNRGKKDTVKETCREAYQKDKTQDASAFPEADVLKFCSLKGK
ncbi:hypothetical protein MHSWG343_04880 [Candidatus Mycoplasma haematohominis]|uniref:Uncharacterized protein n=1 Tax=Candidatus Mycoplasma haematohominis TaxID=1494318 RepID=A0A478FPX4_9MOLU|nr:hypothetical protein MHSWG343_04880 [Candidatus Mycoplasma haemohominis]